MSTARAASSGEACATSHDGAALAGSTTDEVAPSAAAVRSPPSTNNSITGAS
jgi:hypothetical protein